MQLTYHFFSTLSESWHTLAPGGFHDSLNSLLFWSQQGEGGKIPPEFNGCALQIVVGDTRPDSAAKLSQFDREHIGEIICDDGGKYSNYSCHVLRLIKKADAFQRELLRMIYPDHVEALLAWERAPREAIEK